MAKTTIVIEDNLIEFVKVQANKERRSFTGMLNHILEQQMNRQKNIDRKEAKNETV